MSSPLEVHALPPPVDARAARTAVDRHARLGRSPERITAMLGFVAVVGSLAFVITELQPHLLFGSGVDVGGDNGGHIAAPYYLIHHLLPHLQLTGWDPWWFDGFPLYVFYFPLPALLVGALSVIWPYAVAFKLVTALGTVTLPLCAYAFGRLAGFRRPVPVLMAVAMLPYLFNTSYTIDGGNIASTMAGEFSFSLAVSTGLLFLGVTAYALRSGRLRWLAALLFAITCLCHLVPGLAFGAAAAVLALCSWRRHSLARVARVIVPIGVVGALLAAWWLVPFGTDLQYSSSMNYQPVGGPWPHWFTMNFLPQGFLFMIIPAVLGGLLSLILRRRIAIALTTSAVGTVLAFHFLPSGLVYNARWLPFWFLFVCLLAAYGLGELFTLVGRQVAPAAFVCAAIVLGTLGALVGSVFTGGLEGSGFLGAVAPPSHTQVGGWVRWNYSGIQARFGWGDFQAMVRLLDRAGRRYGCGRLQYEYLSETTNPFGSTETMMSLPMWTHGCMDTTDGIYFESSSTTPFHFLDVSEVSLDGEAPDPVVGLDYPGYNLPDGIRHLQLMGVRYFLAMSPEVEAAAAADPALIRIGSAPSFAGPYDNRAVVHPHVVLYLVTHSSLVVPLDRKPVVEPASPGEWLRTNLTWYEREKYWPTLLARSGPRSWPRARPGHLVPVSSRESVRVATTRISRVRTGDESISFDVSQTGTPVLVKIPYFPNWTARGATGPYEVSPNLMAVVPTTHRVRLTYGTTRADWAGKAASLVGLGALGLLAYGSPSPPPLPDSPVAPVLPEGVGALSDLPDHDDDRSTRHVSVVLPAHNEEGLLADTVTTLSRDLSASRRSFEIIVVENGSSDATATVARALVAGDPHVRLIRLSEADYGSALRAGFLAARGRVVVNFDVDYHDSGFLDRALLLVDSGRAAVVLASKRAEGSKDRRPLLRRLLTGIFSRAMGIAVGTKVSDAHGMKALDRRLLRPFVTECELTGSLFDVELVTRGERAGLTIVELPANVEEIRAARTSVLRRSLETLLGLVRLRFLLGPSQPV